MQAPGGPKEDRRRIRPTAAGSPRGGRVLRRGGLHASFDQPSTCSSDARRTRYSRPTGPCRRGTGRPDRRTFNAVTKYVATATASTSPGSRPSPSVTRPRRRPTEAGRRAGPPDPGQQRPAADAARRRSRRRDRRCSPSRWCSAKGRRLFGDSRRRRPTTDGRAPRDSPTGIVIARYVRAGAVKTGDLAADPPSPAERTRREKMGERTIVHEGACTAGAVTACSRRMRSRMTSRRSTPPRTRSCVHRLHAAARSTAIP